MITAGGQERVLPDMVADDRQVSQSGKPLCTGSSLWAVPKLARGRCPLGTPARQWREIALEMSPGHSKDNLTDWLGLRPAPTKRDFVSAPLRSVLNRHPLDVQHPVRIPLPPERHWLHCQKLAKE
jgi:hypothetical protein